MDGMGKQLGHVALLRSPIGSAREPGQRGAGCNSESNVEMHNCFRGVLYDGTQHLIGQAR